MTMRGSREQASPPRRRIAAAADGTPRPRPRVKRGRVLKCLHIITGLDTGGAEMMLRKLVEWTDGHRLRNEVVCLTGNGPVGAALAARGVPVHALGMRGGVPDPRAVARLTRLVTSSAPDVVQTWMYHANLLGGIACRLAHVRPVVWNIRASHLEPGSEKRLTRFVARASARLARGLCDAVVTNSHDARAVHVALGYADALFRVIPNGFDTTTFRPDSAARAAVRAEWGVAGETPVIGMIARYHAAKDHATFVAAAARLREDYPHVQFVLAGDAVDDRNEALGALVRGAGLAGRIRLLGRRDDTPRVFAGLDICTSASAYEAFPNVLGEAMATGVPCVATDVGDSARIIGDTGRVVPVRAPGALARAWADLLGIGPQARQALGARARCRVERHYPIAAVAEQYVALYEELAGVS